MIQKITRKAREEGNNIVTESSAVDSVSKLEFIQEYNQRSLNLQKIQNELASLKEEFVELDPLIETEDLKKFKELITLAQKLIRKDEVIKLIQKYENMQTSSKDELKDITPLYKKITNG